jgi:hypothetical protein
MFCVCFEHVFIILKNPLFEEGEPPFLQRNQNLIKKIDLTSYYKKNIVVKDMK